MKNIKQIFGKMIAAIVCAGMIVTQIPVDTLVVNAEESIEESIEESTAENTEENIVESIEESIEENIEEKTEENIEADVEAIYHTGVVLSVDNDEVSYPWMAFNDNGEMGYKSSNQDIDGSVSQLFFNVSSDKAIRVRFDYGISSESSDVASFYCNDEKYIDIAGDYSGHYDEVLEPGSYRFLFEYRKDHSVRIGADTVYIKNISIISFCQNDEHIYSNHDCVCDVCEYYTNHKHVYENNECIHCGRIYDDRFDLVHKNDGIHLVIDEDSDYAWQREDFAYPWDVYESDGKITLRTGNQRKDSTRSELRFTIDSESTFRCAFNYTVLSEGYDKLYINLNGIPVVNGLADASGRYDEMLEAGHYVFEFSYVKDNAVSVSDDAAYLSDIELYAICDNHVFTTYDCLCDRCEHYVDHYHEYDNEKTACIHCGKPYDNRIDAVRITNGGGIDFDVYEDYPWKTKTDVVNPVILATIDDKLGLVNSNSKMPLSTSNVTFVVRAEKRFNFKFKYYLETETNYDKMTIKIDDEAVLNNISGDGIKGVFEKWLEPGIHKVTYLYTKDGGGDCSRDIAFIYDICIDEPCDVHSFSKYECQCDNCDYYITHTHKYGNNDDKKCIRCGKEFDELGKAVFVKNEVDVISESESQYPWSYNFDENGAGIKSSNQGLRNTESYSTYIIDAETPCNITFDYMVDSENSDRFYAVIDDKTIVDEIGGENITGNVNEWIEPGTHKLTFYYKKDGSIDIGSDTAYVYNISFNGACADGHHAVVSAEDMLDGTHKIVCSNCNVENYVEPHCPKNKAVYTALEDGENHITDCKYCAGKIISKHNVDKQPYVSAGDGTHYKVCKDCGAHVAEGACHGGKANCAWRAVCDDCYEYYGQLSEKHEIVTTKGYAPTCSSEGRTEGKHCSVCFKVFEEQKVIGKLAHIPVVMIGKPATCVENGTTNGTKCLVCGEILEGQVIVAGNHDVSGQPYKSAGNGMHYKECKICKEPVEMEECHGGEATCKAKAICEDCNTSYGQIANTHTVEIVKGRPATCTGTGVSDGEKCSVCGKVLKEQQPIASLGHTEQVIEGKAATCEEEGLTEGSKCLVCGKVLKEQQPIASLGHTEQVIEGKAATCEEEGLTEGTKCLVCGKVLKEQQPIASLGHTEQVIEGKTATCEEEGLTEGSKCSVCGKVLKEQKTVAKTSHNWDDGKLVKEPTYTEEGCMEYTCSICKKTKTEIIPVLESTTIAVQTVDGNFNITLIAQDLTGKALTSVDLSNCAKVAKNKITFTSAKKVKLSGYTCKGWYIANKKASSIKVKNIKEDMVVVARFAENTYSVNYKMVKPDKKVAVNGKIAAQSKISYTESIELSKGTEIAADGYTLMGWSLKKNQTVADYQLGQKVNALAEKNKAKVILYPVWQKN